MRWLLRILGLVYDCRYLHRLCLGEMVVSTVLWIVSTGPLLYFSHRLNGQREKMYSGRRFLVLEECG